jgi:arylsulfatase A-like enzyme
MEPFEWPAWNEYKGRVRRGEYTPPQAEVEQLRAWYDGQLAWVDEQLGKLLEDLRRNGTYDETLIVLVADHGDAFMEHGFVSHSHTPFDELIHVPLIVKLPGSAHAGHRVAEQVALVDLAPTLEELLGAAPRADRELDGASLCDLLNGGPPPAREWVFSEYQQKVAVRSGRWKYIVTPKKARLFDLQADPGETRDVLGEHPELGQELAERVRASFVERERRAGDRVELDEETVRSLTELGYM